MFEMLVFGLGIFELKLATLEPELAILLGIFESELGIFGLKLATLEPELAILLGILEPEHVILESELAILRKYHFIRKQTHHHRCICRIIGMDTKIYQCLTYSYMSWGGISANIVLHKE